MGWVDEVPLLVALAGLVITLIQLSWLRRQLQLDALLRIMDSNRALVALGFDHPQLWTLLEDAPAVGSEVQVRRRYLQLWLNHMQILWTAWRLGVVSGLEWQAFERDMRDSLKTRCLQEHWKQVAGYYPKGFGRLIAQLSPQDGMAEEKSMRTVCWHTPRSHEP